MVICVPVTPDGQVGTSWGRAARVAIAEVAAGGTAPESWHEFDVRWDELHDAGTEGTHHARVATFLREHRVETVLAGHMGPGMLLMLDRMGITVRMPVSGDARAAALTALGVQPT